MAGTEVDASGPGGCVNRRLRAGESPEMGLPCISCNVQFELITRLNLLHTHTHTQRDCAMEGAEMLIQLQDGGRHVRTPPPAHRLRRRGKNWLIEEIPR